MTTKPEIVDTEEQVTASIHLIVPMREMSEHMDPAIEELYGMLATQGVEPTGPLFSYHHRIPTDTFDFEIGVPISGAFQESGRVKISMLPACHVVRSVYQGPYEGLGTAWQEFMSAVDEGGFPASSTFWERYVVGPADTQDPAQYQTELNCVLAS